MIKVGVGILSMYRVDPLLLDVCKEMLCALSCAGGESILAMYVHCAPKLKEWLVAGSILADTIDISPSDEDRNDDDCHSSGQRSFKAPAALVDVSIELLSKICISPSLSSINCTSHSQMGIVLEYLQVLLSPLRATHFCCRRECMQAVLTVFTYYEGEIREIFSESYAQSSSVSAMTAAKDFAMSLAESLLLLLQGCAEDCGSVSVSECAGPIAGLLCHLLINFNDVLDISVINSLLGVTLLSIKNTSSTYVRYSLLMGLIHLFARNASLVANPSSPLLGYLPSSNSILTSSDEGKVSALGFIIDEWCSLHIHLTTRYSGTVSSLGLLELIKIFSKHSTNYGYALKVLRLTLSTLPRILLCPEGTV